MASVAAKNSSLRGVINEVTKEKLKWMENQRDALKAHYSTILEKYKEPENQASLKFLNEINETLEDCPDGDNPAPKSTEVLSVFLNWIDLEDPGETVYFGNKQLIQDRIDKLVKYIKNQIEKCEYSCIYANAMTQYMDSNDEDGLKIGDEGTSEGGDDAKAISGSDKKKTMAEFSKRVFAAAAPEGFSKETFEKLLNEKLFNMEDPTEKEQLLDMRSKVRLECMFFPEDNKITTSDLKLTIGGLLQEGLLGRDKATTLKELKENGDALAEVCTLLNKYLKNYSSWSWPTPVVVNFKRNIAGRYRAYMDEDILTAMLLHFIGAKWSILFKNWYKNIYTSKIWKRGTGTDGDLYYRNDSIDAFRRDFHERSFLSVLPNSMDNLASSRAIYDEEKKESKGKLDELSPMQLKQQLLHIISNEIHLNNVLRPDNPLTVVQTDMEWFGPSLVHEAVLALFKYFGVTEEWLNFFKNFLQAPMKIGSPSAPVQTRKRGAPISHQLTTLFGESLLFVLDLYVNRESGLSIYRIHDDFWFWDHDKEKVTNAWIAMQTFTKLAGLSLNDDKSASIVCKSDSGNDPTLKMFGADPLPQRNVQWGFIVLHSDGVFRISDELLAPHVKEMREYLDKAEGVMKWIHGHNKYIRFFIRNFGDPAQTFQKQHVVQILQKVRSILKQVHPATNGDAAEALKSKYPEIFKAKDVMDAWVHWPVESGGLNLYNPFLDLIPLHEAYREKEMRQVWSGYVNSHLFAPAINQDKCNWKVLIEQSKERRQRRSKYIPHSKEELEEDTITDAEAYNYFYEDLTSGFNVIKRARRITMDERYNRYRDRETYFIHWGALYRELLNNLQPAASPFGNWKEGLYKDQIEGKLGHGETKFVDGNLVPVSLISSMQTERVYKN